MLEIVSKSDIKTRSDVYHNEANTCDRCGISFDRNPNKEYDKEGHWTGKWDCYNCFQKFDPNSQRNIRKSLSTRRTGNQDPNSNQAIGDKFQELTCKWRSTISTIPVEDLNIKNDNYTRGTPIDHSRDSELGIIQTKGSSYSSCYRWWHFNVGREHNKEFDIAICYCKSKDGKTIDQLYIFPKSEIIKRSSITVYKNPTIGVQWYEQYRITDKETINKVNDIWKEIINEVN